MTFFDPKGAQFIGTLLGGATMQVQAKNHAHRVKTIAINGEK